MSDNPFASAASGDTPGRLDPRAAAIASKAAAKEDIEDPANVRNQILEAARKNFPKTLEDQLAKINDREISLPQRLDIISNLQTMLVPLLVGEALAKNPNESRSVALSRAGIGLREIVNVLKTKRDVENSDELNPYSPKFGIVFGWFFDMFHQVLLEKGLDDIAINNIFAAFSVQLIGWEEKIEKRLKGVSGRALDSLQNPFITEFVKSTKSDPVA